MKPAEIRAMTNAQLEQQLTELHTEWRNLRFQEAVGKLTDTARIRKIRKDIARIHTIRTEREMDAAAREALAAAGRL
jgi:large subunit ribosomal protein L29